MGFSSEPRRSLISLLPSAIVVEVLRISFELVWSFARSLTSWFEVLVIGGSGADEQKRRAVPTLSKHFVATKAEVKFMIDDSSTIHVADRMLLLMHNPSWALYSVRDLRYVADARKRMTPKKKNIITDSTDNTLPRNERPHTFTPCILFLRSPLR